MGTLDSFFSPLSLNDWYLLLFALLLAVLIGLAAAKYLDTKNKLIKLRKELISTLPTVSLGVEIMAALYLLIFDANLLLYAWLHWFGLLLFTVLNLALLELYLTTERREISYGLAVLGAIGVSIMLLNIAFDFPFSNFQYGGASAALQYFFGFGVSGTGSTFGVSFSFSLLLVFSAVTMAYGVLKSLEKEKKRKR